LKNKKKIPYRKKHYKIVIAGSGPAGVFAAMCSTLGELDPVVIQNTELVGQLMLTSDGENFDGFDELIKGPALMEMMGVQVEKFGARFTDEFVT
jgi:thioredoxin reductase (NADPH)